MRHMVAVVGAMLLLLGALNSMIARVADTCTQNSPDSLVGGVFTVALNIIGFLCLAFADRPRTVVIASALPALAALSYTLFAIGFWEGVANRSMAACTAITGDPSWQQSGDESFLVGLWLAVALSFWAGLAAASFFAHRRHQEGHKSDAIG